MLLIVGKISVPAAGTPVQLTATAEYQAALTAAGLNTGFKTGLAILFQAWINNTGKVYVGKQTMNTSTGALVAGTIGVPTAASQPSFGMGHQLSPAGITLSDLWLDVDTNGEGPLVSILTT